MEHKNSLYKALSNELGKTAIYARELRDGDLLLEFTESGGLMLQNTLCLVNKIVVVIDSNLVSLDVEYFKGEPRTRHININMGSVVMIGPRS